MSTLSTTATNTFDYTGQIETVSVTVGGAAYYDITADGAQGGTGGGPPLHSNGGYAGGLGAMASGEVYLAAGAQLEIVVGGAGANGEASPGGGGGSSFVIETNNGSGTVNIYEVIASGSASLSGHLRRGPIDRSGFG